MLGHGREALGCEREALRRKREVLDQEREGPGGQREDPGARREVLRGEFEAGRRDHVGASADSAAVATEIAEQVRLLDGLVGHRCKSYFKTSQRAGGKTGHEAIDCQLTGDV